MQTLALVWGILALLGMLVAFFPCLGALNWLNIPFSVVGIIIGAVALAGAGNAPRGGAVAGLVCSGVAALFGFIRLVIGGGLV